MLAQRHAVFAGGQRAPTTEEYAEAGTHSLATWAFKAWFTRLRILGNRACLRARGRFRPRHTTVLSSFLLSSSPRASCLPFPPRGSLADLSNCILVRAGTLSTINRPRNKGVRALAFLKGARCTPEKEDTWVEAESRDSGRLFERKLTYLVGVGRSVMSFASGGASLYKGTLSKRVRQQSDEGCTL